MKKSALGSIIIKLIKKIKSKKEKILTTARERKSHYIWRKKSMNYSRLL